MGRSAAKILGFLLCLWVLGSAQVALSQAAATNWESKPLDYKYQFRETVKFDDAFSNAYDFIVQSSKRSNIGHGLRRLHEDQHIQDQRDYQYWLPHVDIGKSHDSSVLAESIKTEFGFAIAQQAMGAFDFIKRLTRSFKFKANLFEIERDEEAEERRRRNFSIKPEPKAKTSTTQTAKSSVGSGFGLLAGSDESNDISTNTHQSESWRRMGQIEAEIQPTSSPATFFEGDEDQTRFMASLTQGNGFYTLNLPVGKGNVTNGLTHAFRVPLFGAMKIGQDYGAKGETTATGFYNVLASEQSHQPQLNIIYDHLKKRYGTSCVVKYRDQAELSIQTMTPAEQQIQQKDLRNKGAEYTVAYATPL